MYSTSLILSCVAVLVANVSALSDAERAVIRERTLPFILECSTQYNVNEDAIKTAKSTLSTTGLDNCFLGCFLTKTGILNKDGLFDWDTTKAKLKQYVKSKDDFKKFENIANICLPVNDKPVSDNKGCERAKLLFDCFIANKGDFTVFTA